MYVHIGSQKIRSACSNDKYPSRERGVNDSIRPREKCDRNLHSLAPMPWGSGKSPCLFFCSKMRAQVDDLLQSSQLMCT